ncbi:MAG TPA: acyl-CoA dehydratase activase-related protein [Oscillospiraceae bacterium]|nr:acyl-CoA dehydratase activase-related protein [Oscillospiraceae bacterium]
MSSTVGIPRALLYYHYYPAWEAFFQMLGAEVVLSDETSKAIVDCGVRAAVDEACLPVKIYLGHLANLRDKGVDYIFAPRVISVEPRKYLCPKFLGLPEIARFSVANLPELLTVEINVQQKYRETLKGLKQLAARFDWRPWKGWQALQAAAAAQKEYEAKLQQGLTPQAALAGKAAQPKSGRTRVAVLGHAYNINDPFISLNILNKLTELDVEVVTSEMLPAAAIAEGSEALEKDVFWTFGHLLMGAGLHFLQQQNIAGLVLVAAFGCGPDSLTCELIERYYKRQRTVPVILLTLDEHTGEAGMVTRLEAFVDMLRWRKAI